MLKITVISVVQLHITVISSVQNYYEHLAQCHKVFVAKYLAATLIQVSEWYHSLHEEHSIHFELDKSGMWHTQYTGISSTDFTLETVCLFFITGNRHLLPFKTLEEMSPHLCLLKKEVPWLFSKHQRSGKGNWEEATVIPPRLHLHVHKVHCDGWFLSGEEGCYLGFGYCGYAHVQTVQCLYLCMLQPNGWHCVPVPLPCVQNLNKFSWLHIKVHRQTTSNIL